MKTNDEINDLAMTCADKYYSIIEDENEWDNCRICFNTGYTLSNQQTKELREEIERLQNKINYLLFNPEDESL